MRDYFRSGPLRSEAVFAPNRYLFLYERSKSPGMKHFRSVIGKFSSFSVGDLIEDGNARNQAWIGRHDSVHIGPNPEFFGIQASRKDGTGKIRPAATQRSRAAIHGGAVEPSDNRRNSLIDQRAKDFPAFCPSEFHLRRSVSENRVRHDNVASV